MQKIQGFTEAGNTTLTIAGAAGTIARKVQGSFPSATVTVYLAGMVTIASIYSDNSSTPKANPFTAGTDGTFFFYAPNGRYDIKFSGGGIVTPFTLGDFLLFDETTLVVDVTAAPFLASPTASAAANAAAFTAALASMTTGILYFPPGNYSTNGSLTPKTGVTFRGAGAGATVITYSGTGFWLDLGATAVASDVGWEDMDVECSGSSLGALRVGRTAQAFSNALLRLRWHLKNLYLHATPVTMNVGGIGISATEYINWTLDNVTINNFERAAVWDRGGNSTGTRVRFQGFAFGPLWTNNVGGCSDTYTSPEFIGPTTGGAAGIDYGYTVEIGATFVTFINALYETAPLYESQGYIHITSVGGRFTDINGTLSQGVVPDATMVLDNGYDMPRFIGTNCGTGNLAISFGTPAAGGAFAQFIHCNDNLNILAAAQAIGKSTIVGPTSATVFRIRNVGLAIGDVDTMDFGTDVTVNSKRGMFWNNDTNYGVFRPVGAWAGAFQQLQIVWQTGIRIDPGVSSTLSYVDVARGGVQATGTNGYFGATDTTGTKTAPTTGWVLFSDISGGKTRLICRFPTGANQVVATEP